MTTVYPGAIDSLPRPAANTKTNAGAGLNLSSVIDNLSDATEAIETLLGPRAINVGQFNPIINSRFTVWNDGTTIASAANGAYGPECWLYAKVGAVVHDLIRSTDVPTPDTVSPFGSYSLQLDVTTVDSSIAAGDLSCIVHMMEGYLWAPFAQKALTLSFWVKAAKTGVHCVALRNSGSDRSYVAEYTVNVADTWEYKTVSILASPTAGTWNYLTGIGVTIAWTQAAGSTFHTTAGAWQTGNFLATSSQVNETDNTANNFRIFQPRLSLGSSALAAAPIPLPLDEFMTRRYCQSAAGYGTNGVANTTTAIYVSGRFVPEMRAAPTLSLTDQSVDMIESGVGVKSSTGSALTSAATSVHGYEVQMDGFTGLTVGRPDIFIQDGFVLAKARL